MPARVLLGLAFAAVLAWGAAALLARPAPEHPYFAGDFRLLVIAHRGGAGLRPEATLPFFEQADVLELDVRATADGALVVLHDATVDRTTDGTGPVAALKLHDLRKLDAGYRWAQFRGKGLRVPTLEEVFRRHPRHRFVVELKVRTPEFALAVCERIRDSGLATRVLVASFDHATLAGFRAACPEVATSMSRREAQAFWFLAMLHLTAAYTPAGVALQIPERVGGLEVLTPNLLAAARARNLRVHAWTINEEADMRRLATLGVHGMMTDRPDRLLALRGRL